MKRCTTIVQKRRWVELAAATVQTSAKWGYRYDFEHCGKPAVTSREGTNWCEEHHQAKTKEES